VRGPIRSLTGQGVWYATANLLAKAGGLLLLPLYTNSRYLAVSDYGRWGVLEVTAQMGIVLLGLQLSAGLLRFAAEETARRIVARTAWTLSIGIALLLLGGAAGLVELTGDPVWALLCLFVAFEILLGLILGALRFEGRARLYTGLLALKLITLVGLSYLTLAIFRMGLAGVVASYTASSALSLLVAWALTCGRWPWGWPALDRTWTGRLLRFSLPLVAGALGSLALNAADRYVLVALRPEFEVGLYVLAARFGGVVNMLGAQPLQLAWIPLLYRLPREERPRITQTVYSGSVLLLGALVLVTSVFSPWVLTLMGSDAAYRAALPLVPWIGLGFAAFGLSLIWSAVLLEALRSRIVSLALAASAALNVGLNFLLVPLWGPMGAAVSTLVAYAGLLIWTYRAARPLVRIRLLGGRLLGTGIWTGLLAWAGTEWQFSSLIADALFRLLLVLLWTLGAWLLGWMRPLGSRESGT
jgi:O-antigen/teichoic acid export membrane protein